MCSVEETNDRFRGYYNTLINKIKNEKQQFNVNPDTCKPTTETHNLCPREHPMY